MKTYSFCVNTNVGPFYKWHIRILSGKGKKFGGADTVALCGRKVNRDVDAEFSSHNLEINCCLKCAKIYGEAK